MNHILLSHLHLHFLFAEGDEKILHQSPVKESTILVYPLDYAIEHNIDIRQTANAAEQSNVEVNTAKWARLPNLNASAGQNWNWGRTQTAIKDENTGDYSTVYVNTGSHGTNMSVSTSIPLFTGLEIPNQYALAKLNLKAALADLEKAKEDISINIASVYLQVLFNEELYRVSLGQVELSKEQYNRIERLAEVGKASPAEVAEAKARVAQDEMNAVQANNDYRLALLDLSQLIELETPEGFLLEEPAVKIELTPLTPPDEIFQIALGSKASIQLHSIVWKEANTTSESPKAVIIRN